MMQNSLELCAALDRQGYVVIRQALDVSRIARLRRAFETAPVQDGGTQHVELAQRTPEIASWRALERHPALIAAAAHVLSTPFHVRSTHGRNPLPGFGQQGLHCDWPPRGPQDPYFVLTAIWMLDDFTLENGATRLVPGSHRLTRPLAKSLAQPHAKHPEQQTVIGHAGDALVMNGHLWHSGQHNGSAGPRRAVQMVLGRERARTTV